MFRISSCSPLVNSLLAIDGVVTVKFICGRNTTIATCIPHPFDGVEAFLERIQWLVLTSVVATVSVNSIVIRHYFFVRAAQTCVACIIYCPGPIPHQLAAITGLQTLNLHLNQLTGSGGCSALHPSASSQSLALLVWALIFCEGDGFSKYSSLLIFRAYPPSTRRSLKFELVAPRRQPIDWFVQCVCVCVNLEIVCR